MIFCESEKNAGSNPLSNFSPAPGEKAEDEQLYRSTGRGIADMGRLPRSYLVPQKVPTMRASQIRQFISS
jgi:hypothetical protein